MKYTMSYKKEVNPVIEDILRRAGDNTAIYHFTDPKELEKRLCKE